MRWLARIALMWYDGAARLRQFMRKKKIKI